ncbi:futalosine hydrolase [Streptomyces sp. SCUT-3]|uniref:futalosine hydrolase n=1 Tax=Streptomyces sp. SCUT-3 TaxID=2684469 RepID=UPI0015F9C375|nr:futalosine hydrolase [Streptomyces sp. SCUT-3]QMV22944.1 futalosine hydrolase [Streptomyces sp. SCUT-3]
MRLLVVTAVAVERDSAATGLAARFRDAPEEEALPGRRSLLVLRDGRHRADLLAAGVGPAAAAAGTSAALTAAELAGHPYDLVVASGIAGGFLPVAPLGSVVVADEIVAADLGAQTPPARVPPPQAPPPAARTGAPAPAPDSPDAPDALNTPDLPAPSPEAAVPEAAVPVPPVPGPPAEPLPGPGFVPVSELGFGTSSHVPPPGLRAAVAGALGAVCGPVLTVSTVTGTAERAAELAARHPGAAAEGMEGFGVAEAAAAHGVPVLEVRAVSNPVGPRDRAAWRIGDALTALSGAFGGLSSVLDSLEAPAP